MFKYQILLKSVKWEQRRSMRTEGRTDRHDDANSRFSQFFEGAWKRQISKTATYWDVTPCVVAQLFPSSTQSVESVGFCLMSINLYGHSHEDGNLYYHRHEKITYSFIPSSFAVFKDGTH